MPERVRQTLSKRYRVDQKTVAKWKTRETAIGLPPGSEESGSTALPIEDEAIIVAFRRHKPLPRDDCLYAL